MCVLSAFVTKHYSILFLSLSGFRSEFNFFLPFKNPFLPQPQYATKSSFSKLYLSFFKKTLKIYP